MDVERGPQECPKWPGVRFAFPFTTCPLGGPPNCPAGSWRAGILFPRAVGLVGLPHPRDSAPAPHPAPARAPPPRRAGPSPAPLPLPPLPQPPRTPAEARARPGSARSCSCGRMPSVSVSCYGNPDRGEFRIRSRRSRGAPVLPDPPLASRLRASKRSGPNPRLNGGASPEAPAPNSGNARDADRAEFIFPLCCLKKTCQVWFLEVPKTTGTPGKAGHAPGFRLKVHKVALQ